MPILDAIKKRDVTQVQAALAAGEPATTKDERGFTALYHAVDRGNAETVKLLLDSGADSNDVSGEKQQNSPLTQAVSKAHLEMVEMLLRRGADMSYLNFRKQSALHLAAEKSTKTHLKMLEALLKAGADINIVGYGTPLMEACTQGALASAKTLVAAGADVNICTSSGTALMNAVRKGELKIAAYLLANGADMAPKNTYGKTALDIATEKGNKKMVALLETGAVLKPPTPPFAQVMSRFADMLARRTDFAATFNGGASKDALSSLEQTIGAAFPGDVREFYLSHDGQHKHSGEPLFEEKIARASYWLMPIEQIGIDWKMLKGLYDGGEFNEEASPDDGIRDHYWHPLWIPFATDGGGDHLCFDLTPAESGTLGQIIAYSHETSQRRLLARSLGELLAEIVESKEQ